MCSPQIVLDKIVEKIDDKVIQSVRRHLGYLFHYKQSVKNLEVQMDNLQALRRTIEGQIEEAKTRGEVIMDNVLAWLKGADELRQGVETFMHDKIDKENVQCYKFSCPDFISQYRLSKEAEKKMGDVKSLFEQANFGTISHLAPPPPELQLPSNEEYVSLDSRESVFNRIKDALADTKVNVVGVYGLGGVGKTTMVEKVAEQVKKDGLFDEVMMAVVSQDAKVVKIQGVLADHLDLKLEAETEVERAIILWNRLNNGKRNLVILDDIWKKLNLKEIGIPITDGKTGCKVILTSRNQHVLKNMQVDKDFLIELLSEQEAWNLFKKKINVVDSHDPLHHIANAVCRECRGLPVVILAVGAALKGKSMSAWNSSLHKLKMSTLNAIEDIDPNLFNSLRLSYDYLESTNAKSCFLLCCLFPEDAQVPIEELARQCMVRRLLDQDPDTLEEARDIVCSAVNTLKTSCLLLDGKNDEFVKMHDIVRYVAILIAKEEKAFLVKHGVKEWPEMGTCEKYSAISLSSETIHELPDELVCPELHTLMLEFSSSNILRKPSTKISDKFFRGAEKLMVLELNRATVSELPSSLGKLTELRMLCLNECILGDIAILKDLKNKLEVLILRGSDIKVLPRELGELTSLRLLDLRDCKELEVIPNGVISILHRLEELHFPYSFNNWKDKTANEEISKVSLEELMSLTRLSTLDICIPFLRLLPEDLGFLNLSRFFIIVGSPGPQSYYGGYLKRERFSSTSVVMNRVNYENDGLIDFCILERLLGKPKWSIERGGLYPSRSFNNLTELVLLDCELKYLFSPSCARRLLLLQRLVIHDCETMEAVIGNFGNEEEDEEIITNVINFSQLTTLELDGLPRLTSFYPRIKKATTTESHSFAPTQSLFNEKVAFPALEDLKISEVPMIKEIWVQQPLSKLEKEVESFCKLKFIMVWSCDQLEYVLLSYLLPQLHNLLQLSVQNCYNLEVIVSNKLKEKEATNNDILVFPQLKTLTLRDLDNLKCFCTGTQLLFSHKVAFPALEHLQIWNTPSITEIWDKKSLSELEQEIESFSKLVTIDIYRCDQLVYVLPSYMLPPLQNFQKLKIRDCDKVEVIVSKELKEKEATDNDTIVFPQLKDVVFSDLPKLKSFYTGTHLFSNKVTFPRLENLELDGCESLRYIFQPSMARVLVNLQELIINDCSKMEAVVGGEKEIEDRQGRISIDKTLFPHLSKLELRRLPNLRRFCHFGDPLELPLLSQIVMWDCPSMDLSSLGYVSPPNLSLEGPSFSPDHRSGRDAPPGPELPSIMDCEDFHSRHKVFKGIVEALKDPEVNMIGVYGTGGVGKTTMVDKVGKLVKKDGFYDEVIKAVVSYDASVKEIQGQLADSLNLMLRSETEKRRAKQLWNRFTGKNILIILDDVWQELDFSEIGIPIRDLNKRCKVVITSQNRYVLKKMDVHKDFKIEFLSEVEAWTLFKKEVGNYVDSHDQQLHDIAQAVCKYSEGLPVAINALGAALRGKDMYAWQDALNKLKKSMLWDIEGINTTVYGSLRRNYDRLDFEDAKACFLLCCLFSEDAEIPIDGLVRYYMAGWTFDQKPDTLKRALYQVRTLVDTLKNQCLLLDGNSEDTVKMHTVMRHVSTSIANDDESFFVEHLVKDWPEKAAYEHCSVISLRPNYMREFPNELVCPKLHTLRLDCTGNKFHVQVPDKFFSGTENLTILDLKRVTILPASLAKLAKLQMLCLNGCNLGDIAILKDLKDHLEILSLQGSDIEKLPPEVGKLTRLRLLDMADCKGLRMIPKGVISNLLSLEELYMPRSFRQWEGTTQSKISCVSLDELMSLTQLTTLHFHIPDTALLPTNFTFGKLDRYRISIGGEGLIGNWGQGDRALVLENIHIANALEYFVGKGKWIMQRNGLYLPTSFNHLTNLSVRDCRLKYLFSPSCAKGLDQLQYLTVESCTVTEGVIGIEGEKDEDIVIIFRKLKYLSLDGLPNLISFYPREEKTAKNSGSSSSHSQMVLFNDKVIFSVLERLTISKVGNITEIFDKQSIAVIKEQGSFCRLMYVDVKDCDNLMHVFPSKMCPMLMNPHELDVQNCGSMEGIIEFEGELDKDGLENEVCLSKLRRMKLRSLPKFISICTKLGKAGTTAGNSIICAQPFFAEKVIFPRLENLELEECGSLTYIFQPSMARDFVNLQELIINDCSKMEAVLDGEEEIDGQGRKSTDKTLFPYLIKLELRHLPKLRRFCHSSNPLELPLLSQMVIWDCPRMDSFSLGYMSSSANAQMVLFVNDKVAVPRLGILELKGCKNLRYIFQPSLARVVRLQELIINYCSEMEAVIDGQQEIEEGQGTKSTETLLPHLSKLELRRLPKLERFCHFRYPVELPLLSQMIIEVCPRMNSFSSGSVSTPNLFAQDVSYDFVGDDTTVTEEEEPSKIG